MTQVITREQAEACVEQIKLMYHGFREESGFGKPLPTEDPDNEGCWLVRWDEGPYLFGSDPVDIPGGRPNGGVPAASDWPDGIIAESVSEQVVRLRRA